MTQAERFQRLSESQPLGKINTGSREGTGTAWDTPVDWLRDCSGERPTRRR